MRFIWTILSSSVVVSCSMFERRVDADQVLSVDGFTYHYPRVGIWILGSADGQRDVIKLKSSGTESVIAYIINGPIGVTTEELAQIKKTGKFKPHSPEEIISSVRKDIEADSKNSRVSSIKTEFEEKKFVVGSCLIYSQIGGDKRGLPISHFTKFCYNSKTYSFISMNLSARVDKGKQLPDLTTIKNDFFNSLSFVE